MLNFPIPQRLHAALGMADAAGGLTLAAFGRRARAARKKDRTEVTATDRACERLLRKEIRRAFPRDGILGEEYGETRGSSGYRWVLDPIDGTTSFIRGVPLYGVLVAVEHGERAVIGVIHMPALRETVYAWRGGGAWRQVGCAAEPVRVSKIRALSESLVLTTSQDYFRIAGQDRAWEAVRRRAGATRGWSDCYAFVLVATGRADAAIEPHVKAWDIAAPRVVVEEAGGRFTDWSGGQARGVSRCVASNGLIHDALLRLVRPRGGR